MGPDGHVAFHQRETPETFRFGSVWLHADNAIRLGLDPGTEALSVGLAALMELKAILLILLGSEKWGIFKRALAGDDSLPITALLKKHPDFTVITDQFA